MLFVGKETLFNIDLSSFDDLDKTAPAGKVPDFSWNGLKNSQRRRKPPAKIMDPNSRLFEIIHTPRTTTVSADSAYDEFLKSLDSFSVKKLGKQI